MIIVIYSDNRLEKPALNRPQMARGIHQRLAWSTPFMGTFWKSNMTEKSSTNGVFFSRKISHGGFVIATFDDQVRALSIPICSPCIRVILVVIMPFQ